MEFGNGASERLRKSGSRYKSELCCVRCKDLFYLERLYAMSRLLRNNFLICTAELENSIKKTLSEYSALKALNGLRALYFQHIRLGRDVEARAVPAVCPDAYHLQKQCRVNFCRCRNTVNLYYMDRTSF